MSDLTDKQAAFVQEYIIDLNATQAAIRAGYSKDTAGAIGHENLKKPEIASAITAALAARAERTQVTQDYVLSSIVQTMERCKQAEPVLDRKGKPVYVENEAGEMVPAYVFNASGVLQGARLLGEHLGTFKDRLELSGTIETSDAKTTLLRGLVPNATGGGADQADQ